MARKWRKPVEPWAGAEAREQDVAGGEGRQAIPWAQTPGRG